MANFININKTVRIEAHGVHTNGNTKGVVCITNSTFYTSVTDAAKTAEVSVGSMSNHIRGLTKTCKGNVYMFADDPRVIPAMAKQIATKEKENSTMASKLSEMDELRAKAKAYDKLIAEEEKRQADIANMEAYIASHEAKRSKLSERYAALGAKIEAEDEIIAKAKEKLDALKGNRKEVA